MNTEWSKPTKYITGVSLALLGIYVLYLSRPIIPLLIVAALIAVIVRPVILWLHLRVRLPRGLAVAVVYLGLLILTPLVLLLAIPTIVDALDYIINLDYQSILQDIVEWLQSTLVSIKAVQLPVASFDAWVDQTVDTLLEDLQQITPTTAPDLPTLDTILASLISVVTTTFDVAAGLVGAVASKVTLLIFMFLASMNISLEAHTYRDSLLHAAPAAYQPEIAILLNRIEQLWNAFFRGQLTLMFLVGLISWLGLAALGVPGALYLGIIAGFLEIIPNIGPVISAIPAVIVAVLMGSDYLPINSLFVALLVILLYTAVQQVENNLIVPRVLGGAVELPPLVVMAGVMVGTSIGGILGALLATPVIASSREIVRYLYRKTLGEEPFPIGEAVLKPRRKNSSNLLRSLRRWRQRLTGFHSLASRQRLPDASPTSDSDSDKKSGIS